ncbi:uncharacterized protein LOC144582509 isoform X2 [Callithrix jacchus]
MASRLSLHTREDGFRQSTYSHAHNTKVTVATWTKPTPAPLIPIEISKATPAHTTNIPRPGEQPFGKTAMPSSSPTHFSRQRQTPCKSYLLFQFLLLQIR